MEDDNDRQVAWIVRTAIILTFGGILLTGIPALTFALIFFFGPGINLGNWISVAAVLSAVAAFLSEIVAIFFWASARFRRESAQRKRFIAGHQEKKPAECGNGDDD